MRTDNEFTISPGKENENTKYQDYVAELRKGVSGHLGAIPIFSSSDDHHYDHLVARTAACGFQDYINPAYLSEDCSYSEVTKKKIARS